MDESKRSALAAGPEIKKVEGPGDPRVQNLNFKAGSSEQKNQSKH